MGVEIERKFLVKNLSFVNEAHKKEFIKQGYLSTNKNRVIRVRVLDSKGYLTIKGIANVSGISRKEWEYEIDFAEALELLKICEPTIIEKNRYYVLQPPHVFEIDMFESHNKGLIIAEVELSSEDEVFEKPIWLGEEVTGNAEYYNSYLTKHPFNSWK